MKSNALPGTAGVAGGIASTTTASLVALVLSALWAANTVVRADDYGLPTEVVEEWGCHDTELRLTCGRLDATIALLEATYTPNCTGQPDDDACIHMDFKKLTRSYTASPRVDAHLTETEAGRQFLETLQRHRLDTERAEAEERDRAARGGNDYGGVVGAKSKRNSLRDTLEMLIVDYLRELSPDSPTAALLTSPAERNADRRQRRSARQADYYDGEQQEENDEQADADADDRSAAAVSAGSAESRVDVNDLRKIEIGSRNITVLPTQRSRVARIGKPSECAAFRRRVTKLDQYELDKALMKDDESRELNIRRVLNHRCSGKNHCSFVFSSDYPFSILWHDGIVRIKYICMNNFRLNKFCDERLHIDNEPVPTLESSPPAMPADRKGEPVAEARIQNDQSFHHLKILKSGDTPPEAPTGEPADASSSPDVRRGRKQSRVYSQDFRFFKVIPSSVDQRPTGENNATNEILLKVDASEPGTEMPVATTTTMTTTEAATTQAAAVPSSVNTDGAPHVIETTTIAAAAATIPPTKDTPKPSITSTTTVSPLYTIPDDTDDVEDISNDIIGEPRPDPSEHLAKHVAMVTTPTPTAPPATTTTRADPYGYEDNDEDYDRSPEDYTIETYGSTVVRKNRVRVHTSYQVAANADWPLRQGFLATTGYPKYYIGESNCSWTLTAPHGHRVRLTVLDLNLRVDNQCRDVLEIVDQNSVIFNSCQELAKPMQIVSDSNEIKVTVRTTSKLAYPKRGVLIHYTAMGCLLLPLPANGRLVHTARDTAKYACDPSFVFADTAASSRELHCNEHYTWDKPLPDCIEQHRLQPNAITDIDRSKFIHSVNNRTHPSFASPTLTSTKMADNANMLYDVAIPSMVIAGLFLVNAVIFVVIMRYRNKRKNEGEFDTHEMSRL